MYFSMVGVLVAFSKCALRMLEFRTCLSSFGMLQIGICDRSTFQRSGEYPVSERARGGVCSNSH